MWSGKRVFVSGGAGVIGRVLVEKLLTSGAEVFVGDLEPCPIEWSGQLKYRQGDLNYLEKWELEHFSPDYFFHLAAAFERSVESYEFWEDNFQNNIRLSNHLMTLFKDLSGLRKVVFASSYLIYDSSLYMFKEPVDKAAPLSESMAIFPRNLTGMAKLAHEVELGFLQRFRSSQFSSVFRSLPNWLFTKYERPLPSFKWWSCWSRMRRNGFVRGVYRPRSPLEYGLIPVVHGFDA